MKLLTKAIEKSLPALYSQEDNPDPDVVLHYFNPLGQGDWFITEGEWRDEDFLMFGLCDLGYPELGYVSLSEMENVKLKWGMGIERDLHWTPKPLSEVRAKACA